MADDVIGQTYATGGLALDDGAPAVLDAVGSSVLRFRGRESTWLAEPGGTAYGSADLRHVIVSDEDGIAVRETTAGREVARLDDARLPRDEEVVGWSAGERLIVTTQGDDHRTVSYFDIPSLRPVGSETLPLPRGLPPDPQLRDVGSVTGEVTARLYAGVLTVWDRETGEQRHDPIELGKTAEDKDFYRDNPFIAARPGQPNEVAVATPNGDVDLWDVAEGRVLRTFPATVARFEDRVLRAMVFDRTGRRLATLAETHDIVRYWLADTGAADGKPLVTPNPVEALVGFGETGELITVSPPGAKNGQSTYVFWAPDRRRMAEFHVVNELVGHQRLVDGRWLVLSAEQTSPVRLSTNPKDWFDRLCAVSDRPFTDAELRTLPAEVDRSPPCG